jgi:hypothetical protein
MAPLPKFVLTIWHQISILDYVSIGETAALHVPDAQVT